MSIKRIIGAAAALLMVLAVVPFGQLIARADELTVPEGYAPNEYRQIAAFLEIEDDYGVKNGEKVSEYEGYEYDVSDPATWGDWFFFPGEYMSDGLAHIMMISWSDLDLVGELDVSGFTMLSGIYLDGNLITSIDASDCPELGDVDISAGEFVNADFSNCVSLNNIMCNDCQLETLDVSGCVGMVTGIICDNNNLTALDVSDCPQIKTVVCHHNNISLLNVSGCSEMTSLYAQYNELTDIDLSDCTSLKVLNLEANKLTEIDMEGLPNMHMTSVTAEGPGYVGCWDTMMNGNPFTILYAYPQENCDFLGWYDGEDCISTEAEWNISDEYDNMGTTPVAKFQGNGYHIVVTNDAGTAASTSINVDSYYLGEVTFTVESTNDVACAVGVLNADGTVTPLVCSTEDGVHSYTVNVEDSDVQLVVVIKGDVDLNGVLRGKDSTMLKRYVAGTAELTPLQFFAGDADGNGVISGRETTMLARAVAGSYTYTW